MNKTLFSILTRAVKTSQTKHILIKPNLVNLITSQQNKLASTFTSFNKKNQLNLETKFNDSYFEFTYNNKANLKLYKDLPYIWLRNNCRCSKCYNFQVQEVELDLQRIPLDVKPTKVEQVSSDLVKLTWEDGHVSEFNLIDLANLAFENELKEQFGNKKLIWNKRILDDNGGLKTFKYENYMTDNEVLKEALKAILKYGAVLINNVPANLREIVPVSERIAKIQGSIFGPGDCVVTNQLGFIDRAYTNLALGAHNDNTFLKNTAGLEAFHVVKKADKGGESLLLDGFYCADQLRKHHPKEFNILTNTMVKYNFFKQGEYDLRYTDAMIKLNPLNQNEFTQIRYTAYLQQNVNQLKNRNEFSDFFKALKLFVDQIENKENHLWLSLNPDQVLIFDNFRLLHGRAAFAGNRTLVTSYMPQDEWLSKAHILGADN